MVSSDFDTNTEMTKGVVQHAVATTTYQSRKDSWAAAAYAFDVNNTNKFFPLMIDILECVRCILLRNTIGFRNFYTSGFSPMIAGLNTTNSPAFHRIILFNLTPIRLPGSIKP